MRGPIWGKYRCNCGAVFTVPPPELMPDQTDMATEDILDHIDTAHPELKAAQLMAQTA